MWQHCLRNSFICGFQSNLVAFLGNLLYGISGRVVMRSPKLCSGNLIVVGVSNVV
ncbi:MAG: hypothetical protein KME22_17295 [Hassallia sp. WJT32-NPBG1]|nr:hypothetical protein [Hassallia sp. WJT32-NPBG1]